MIILNFSYHLYDAIDSYKTLNQLDVDKSIVIATILFRNESMIFLTWNKKLFLKINIVGF